MGFKYCNIVACPLSIASVQNCLIPFLPFLPFYFHRAQEVSFKDQVQEQDRAEYKDQVRDKVQVRGRVRVEVKINHWTYLQGQVKQRNVQSNCAAVMREKWKWGLKLKGMPGVISNAKFQ